MNPTTRDRNARRLRVCELVLVLAVAFALPIFSSLYLLATGEKRASQIGDIRVIGALITETTALVVFFYVLFRQGRSARELGLRWDLQTLPRAVVRAFGLTILAMLASQLTRAWMSQLSVAASGHKLDFHAEKLPVLAISIWTILFVVFNGWFEELIVRAFAIVEIEFLTKSKTWAVIFSVVFQTSYHFYQGAPQAISYVPIFLIFSLFYIRTRDILPVALAHIFIDLISVFAFSQKH